MVQAIQVLRFHLLELEKVSQYVIFLDQHCSHLSFNRVTVIQLKDRVSTTLSGRSKKERKKKESRLGWAGLR
jgi:hypothetical protein